MTSKFTKSKIDQIVEKRLEVNSLKRKAIGKLLEKKVLKIYKKINSSTINLPELPVSKLMIE